MPRRCSPLAGFNTSIPILPFIEHDLGVTDPVALKLWVGACQTLVSVALMVFAPIWGRLADTRGKRLMLLRATFGGALAMALMGVVTRPWQLLALRGLQGIARGDGGRGHGAGGVHHAPREGGLGARPAAGRGVDAGSRSAPPSGAWSPTCSATAPTSP